VGHNLTNASTTGGVIYTFTGQMVGNAVSAYSFAQKGWNLLANSYTAKVEIGSILGAMPANVEASVYAYGYDNVFHQVTAGEIEAGEADVTEIAPMQAFFLHATEAGVGTQNVAYGTILNDPTVSSAPARRAAMAIDYTGRVFITATSLSGVADQVKLREAAEWTDSEWNTMDGTKLITEGHGIYAMNNSRLASFATNSLVGTVLGFTAGSDSEYTLSFSNIIGDAYILKDLLTGTTVEMTETESYTFQAEPNSVNDARFIITERRNTPAGMNETEMIEVRKVIENGNLIIIKDGIRHNVLGGKMQ
jgi:hypothetical protein